MTAGRDSNPSRKPHCLKHKQLLLAKVGKLVGNQADDKKRQMEIPTLHRTRDVTVTPVNPSTWEARQEDSQEFQDSLDCLVSSRWAWAEVTPGQSINQSINRSVNQSINQPLRPRQM